MSINAKHLRTHVVEPALVTMAQLGDERMNSPAAVELLLGTAWQESRGRHLVQLARRDGRRGPALGLWQMEPRTAAWIESKLRAKRYAKLNEWMRWVFGSDAKDRRSAMITDLACGCIYARLRFWFVRAPLSQTPVEHAAYWKRYYNSIHGAGTQAEWLKSYEAFRREERRSPA